MHMLMLMVFVCIHARVHVTPLNEWMLRQLESAGYLDSDKRRPFDVRFLVAVLVSEF